MENRTLDSLANELVEAVQALCDARNEGEGSAVCDGLKKEADAALDAYNRQALCNAYSMWNSMEHPVREMLKARFVPGLKRYSVTLDKKTTLFVAKISNKTDVRIDFVSYAHDTSGNIDGFMHFQDRNWFTYCQKLAYVLANALNDALGKDPSFRYEVDAAASTFEFSKEADPKSVKSRKNAIQMCVDAIYHEEGLVVTKQDLVYIENALTKQGKGLGEIAIGNTYKMAELITEIMSVHLRQIDGDDNAKLNLSVSDR